MLCAGVVQGEQYWGYAPDSLGESCIGVVCWSRSGRAVLMFGPGVVRGEQCRCCTLEL